MKSIPVLLSVLAAAIFASCSREDNVAPPAHEDQNWAILTEAAIPKEYRDCFPGIWQPSELETPRIIREARLYLEKLKKTTSSDDQRKQIEEILAGWDNYRCQVIGHTRDGEKLMHLEFFLKEEGSRQGDNEYWRHHCFSLEIVYGGARFWRIEYDTKAKVFSELNVNFDA